MFKFELKIYGKDDEVIKTYGTNIIRFGILEEAVKLSEEIKDKNQIEQFCMIKPLIASVFSDLDPGELKNASYEDVFNLFQQIMSIAKGLNSGKTEETKEAKKTEEE